ncbi:MAG: glycosyltransferase family 2 protein [Bacteroidota bacterium]
MNTYVLEVLLWLGIFIVFYAYLGYGLVLSVLIQIKRLIKGRPNIPDLSDEDLPEVTFVVAAYNEEDWIEEKVANCLEFDYPRNKIQLLFVTDGSDDRTPELIRNYSCPTDAQLVLHHQNARRGKIAAVERIMDYIETSITIYTDANTLVNPQAIRKIVRHYADPRVGAVAGEKRIAMSKADSANAAGEGIYWKYESTLKRWDSEFHTVVGAAGELFSIRTDLYQPVPQDSIIEDFFMTMRIAGSGYRVRYEPESYAVESSSASVKEELKRKIRIAAGGLQSIFRLLPLLNVFKYGWLSFQYVSHRALRWTLAPLALPLVLLTNLLLVWWTGSSFYSYLLMAQLAFYGAALIGWILEKQKIKFKAFFVPYYFCVMNYAVYRGFGRYLKGSQSVIWERAKRAESVSEEKSLAESSSVEK